MPTIKPLSNHFQQLSSTSDHEEEEYNNTYKKSPKQIVAAFHFLSTILGSNTTGHLRAERTESPQTTGYLGATRAESLQFTGST